MHLIEHVAVVSHHRFHYFVIKLLIEIDLNEFLFLDYLNNNGEMGLDLPNNFVVISRSTISMQ